MGYINQYTAPSVIQLANDTLGKMCNRYVELYLSGGAYEYIEQQIVLISSYIDAASINYQELADTDETYQDLINNLYNIVSLQEYTPYTYGEPISEGFQYTLNQTSAVYDGFTSVTSYTPNRFIISNEFGYPVASDINPLIFNEGTIRQTDIVYPGDGVFVYTFPELIGKQVYTVYRGTGTILRTHSGVATDDFVQLNSTTGLLTFKYSFSDNEGLWVQYRSII